jgi:hypothetical protein
LSGLWWCSDMTGSVIEIGLFDLGRSYWMSFVILLRLEKKCSFWSLVVNRLGEP